MLAEAASWLRRLKAQFRGSRSEVESAKLWEARFAHSEVSDFRWYIPGPPQQLLSLLDKETVSVEQCLDIGCGPGEVASFLWSRDSERVIGFDIARTAVEEARRFAEGAGAEPDLLVASAPAFPFKDSSFSFAFDRGCLHLLRKDAYRTYISEIARILRPGGHLLLIEQDRIWSALRSALPPQLSVVQAEKFTFRFNKRRFSRQTTGMVCILLRLRVDSAGA